jgi:hypothetical protein
MAVTRRVVLLLVPVLALAAGAKTKKKTGGEPSVKLVNISIRRLSDAPVIAIDGKIANPGPHPIRDLTLIFDVLGMDGQVVSRQRGKVDDDPFDPGAEFEFHWQMPDQARAVEIRIRGVARHEDPVDIDNSGPYAIE